MKAQVNGHQFKTIERALTSLLNSTNLTIKYEDRDRHMTVKLYGRNSPYISHQTIEFDSAIYSQDVSVRDILEDNSEPSFLFCNSRFLALVLPFAPEYEIKPEIVKHITFSLIPANLAQGILLEAYRYFALNSREMDRCFDPVWIKVAVLEKSNKSAEE